MCSRSQLCLQPAWLGLVPAPGFRRWGVRVHAHVCACMPGPVCAHVKEGENSPQSEGVHRIKRESSKEERRQQRRKVKGRERGNWERSSLSRLRSFSASCRGEGDCPGLSVGYTSGLSASTEGSAAGGPGHCYSAQDSGCCGPRGNLLAHWAQSHQLGSPAALAMTLT